MVQWLRLCLPMQGVQVRSLVGELRYHMPPVQKAKNIKQRQYCNKFNKDFKKGPHQKTLKQTNNENDRKGTGICGMIALENPWTEEPGRLQSMGSQRVGHD